MASASVLHCQASRFRRTADSPATSMPVHAENPGRRGRVLRRGFPVGTGGLTDHRFMPRSRWGHLLGTSPRSISSGISRWVARGTGVGGKTASRRGPDAQLACWFRLDLGATAKGLGLDCTGPGGYRGGRSEGGSWSALLATSPPSVATRRPAVDWEPTGHEQGSSRTNPRGCWRCHGHVLDDPPPVAAGRRHPHHP